MRRVSRWLESMSGWRGCTKLQKKQTPNLRAMFRIAMQAGAQHPTPINLERASNVQPKHLKTHWMTISISLPRLVFYSNRFVKPIAQWIKPKWTRPRQTHGWTGGNG